MTINHLVEQARTLSQAERVELLKRLVDIVAQPVPPRHKRSILEFEGIAAHLADEEDPQDYLRRLRSEWDTRL